MDAKKELADILPNVLRMTEERLAKAPDYPVYKAIKAQLDIVAQAVKADTPPTLELKRAINFDLIALRALEHDDPVYLSLLSRTSLLYRQL